MNLSARIETPELEMKVAALLEVYNPTEIVRLGSALLYEKYQTGTYTALLATD